MTAGAIAASTRPSESDWAAALELLAPSGGVSQPVTLACHVSPDGDALGSMIGLALALRRLGRAVVCTWGDDPPVVPKAYRHLAGLELVTAVAELPPRLGVVVTLDTGSLDRLGALAPLAETAEALLVVDHHASNTRFGTHHLLDTEAAATAVLVAGLIDRLGVAYDADIATALYTGLTTDTGSFKYAATTPAVHELAARLLRTGFRHDLVSRAIWDTAPAGYLRLLGSALRRLELEPEAAGGLGLVWTHTTTADLQSAGLDLAEIEGVIDVIRTCEEAEVAVVCKTAADGSLRVSTRSKGRVDMGTICVALGGGGHRFAAGFTSYDDVPTTMSRLRECLASSPHVPR